jgi:hypothetical protein
MFVPQLSVKWDFPNCFLMLCNLSNERWRAKDFISKILFSAPKEDMITMEIRREDVL